jgi:hypothetical protein
MKVSVTALGVLKKYIPEEKDFDLEDGSDLRGLARETLGIPPEQTRISFVVNGRIQKETYQVQPDDKIVILKMGGAG